ncbi:MAG: sulfite exporter TauE/SafE family protein [Lachnospiraceae bacterium]|nr:sulfite exporter TauE/SafE family protein [Lachnospiraceae bacterium]
MVLRAIQGVFIIFVIAILIMFFKDYGKNKEKDVNGKQMAGNYFIGFITNFFDTLGIGSFAPTMALFKLTKLVPDRLIPGTLNVGDSIPVILEAFIFITVIKVETITLVLMLAAGVLGGFLGVKFCKELPERGIRSTMAIGLLIAAILMVCSKFGWIPAGGTAIGLTGVKLVIGVVANFILGCLLPLGIGNYAPCMVIVYLLGMSPAVAFPLMMGSGAIVLCASSIRFIPAGYYHRKASWGLISAGIIGVLIAAYIVKSLPLSALQWLVILVITYTSIQMFYQVLKGSNKSKPKAKAEV